MTFRIIPALPEHVETIAARMRTADVEEVRAASGRSPASALHHSIERSDMSYTVILDGRPEFMFGCGTVDLLTSAGAPWLLGTDEIENHRRHFLAGSRYWVKVMRERYSHLRNAVDDRNEMSKRWLKWLGFTLGDPIPYGYERLPFRIFEMVTDV